MVRRSPIKNCMKSVIKNPYVGYYQNQEMEIANTPSMSTSRQISCTGNEIFLESPAKLKIATWEPVRALLISRN